MYVRRGSMSDIYTDEHVTSTEGVCLCVCAWRGGPSVTYLRN